jgi:hypothetical protein
VKSRDMEISRDMGRHREKTNKWNLKKRRLIGYRSFIRSYAPMTITWIFAFHQKLIILHAMELKDLNIHVRCIMIRHYISRPFIFFTSYNVDIYVYNICDPTGIYNVFCLFRYRSFLRSYAPIYRYVLFASSYWISL